jgi:dihydroorotase
VIVIHGGEVLTPAGWIPADVAVEGERIVAVGVDLIGDTVVDATGCWVGPGFIDMHTHLRDPGQTWKEDLESGTRAAAAGGFTAVTAMPNTDPAMDTPQVVESVLARAADVALIDVIPSASLTTSRSGLTPTEVEALYQVGVRLFTDDGDSVADPDVLHVLMGRLAELPRAMLAQHAEAANLTINGHMNAGAMATRLGIGGLPAEAEYGVVERDLALAATTGVHYHCQHVSAKKTVELIASAKEAGRAVTAEVTPHHLTFDESYVGDLDPDFKMYPPLRSEEDRRALLTAVEDGTIDVVATDHAPHLPEEKRVGFRSAPRGVIGLETAASAVWEALGDRDRLFEVLSQVPARLLGLEDQGQPVSPGTMANIVVYDPSAVWTADIFSSKSSNSPYRGRQMRGQVTSTFYRGDVVHQSGVLSA